MRGEHDTTTAGGMVHAIGVTNGPTSAALTELFGAEQAAAVARIDATPLAELPSLTAWRRVFGAFGVEPTRYRNAAEALLRRLTKHGHVPSVSTLVDLCNVVSIRYALPVAVFDVAGVQGAITVRFAEGDEPFVDLGSEAIEHPEPGEVIFLDEAGVVHARRWCWRQSAASATRVDTTETLVTVEGHHDTAGDDVAAALADLERLLREHARSAGLAASLVRAPE